MIYTYLKKVLLFSILFFAGLNLLAQEEEENNGESNDENETPVLCQDYWGPDSIETIKALSMFNQYYQEKEYVASFPYWKYLFENTPCLNKRITYNGPFIIKKVLREEAYKERFSGLVDTIFLCHQKRIEFFGDEAYVKGKWADDISKLTPKDRPKGLAMFAEAISLSGNSTHYEVPKDYIYAAIKEYNKESLSMDSLLAILDLVYPIIDYNVANNIKDSLKWVATQTTVTKMMLPYLDCDKIIELKQPMYEANKNDLNYLKSSLKLMGRGGCESKEFYLTLSEQLYKLEPNAQSALALAKAFLKKDDNAKAKHYYEKAASGYTGKEQYDIYIVLAKLSLRAGELIATRDYARKALEINAASGEAYIIIGDAYVNSVSTCSGSVLKGREVYWAAVDKYARAKSLDPSVAEEADRRIGKYSAYFPDKETAFFNSITDGSSYTVGCWIGETTVVRTIAN